MRVFWRLLRHHSSPYFSKLYVNTKYTIKRERNVHEREVFLLCLTMSDLAVTSRSSRTHASLRPVSLRKNSAGDHHRA